jgi:ABC-type glycerol-3-phosphate transport system permease component
VQSQLYRNSRESRIFDAANLLFLTLLAAVTLYPLVYTVVVSLSAAYVANPYFYLWPVQPNLGAYQEVLGTGVFWRSFLNSLFYTTCASLLGVALTLMTAYPLSIGSFPLRNFLTFFITFTLLFNGGLIPYYLVVRALGMLNTPWAMIVPGALTAFNVLVARTYLQANVPPELREAARVDGAGDWTVLLRIVLPLSAPIVAVVGLFSAVSHWNSYYWALIFLNRVELYPLSLLLRDIVVGVLAQGGTDPALSGVASPNAVRAATLIVAMLPIMAVYPFLQRYFVRGLTIGAIKG